MVMAPSAATPPVAPKALEIVEVKIPGGTPVEVELSHAVSSDDAVEGRWCCWWRKTWSWTA